MATLHFKIKKLNKIGLKFLLSENKNNILEYI